jgi:hypothetical protein
MHGQQNIKLHIQFPYYCFPCVYLCINIPNHNAYLHTTEKSCHHSKNCIGPFIFISEPKGELFPVRQCQIGFYNGDRQFLLRCMIWVFHWHIFPPSATSSHVEIDYFVFSLAKKRDCLCRNLFSIRGEFSLICIPNIKIAYRCYFILSWVNFPVPSGRCVGVT